MAGYSKTMSGQTDVGLMHKKGPNLTIGALLAALLNLSSQSLVATTTASYTKQAETRQ